MRFGLFTSMGAQTWSGVLDLWRQLESTGWDIACVTDNFMPNTKEREGAMLESWSTLSALAALVPTEWRPRASSTSLSRGPRVTCWSRATRPHRAPSPRNANTERQRLAKSPSRLCTLIAAPTSVSPAGRSGDTSACPNAGSLSRAGTSWR